MNVFKQQQQQKKFTKLITAKYRIKYLLILKSIMTLQERQRYFTYYRNLRTTILTI